MKTGGRHERKAMREGKEDEDKEKRRNVVKMINKDEHSILGKSINHSGSSELKNEPFLPVLLPY